MDIPLNYLSLLERTIYGLNSAMRRYDFDQSNKDHFFLKHRRKNDTLIVCIDDISNKRGNTKEI